MWRELKEDLDKEGCFTEQVYESKLHATYKFLYIIYPVFFKKRSQNDSKDLEDAEVKCIF